MSRTGPVPIRFNDDDLSIIHVLRHKFGLSTPNVVRMALRVAAELQNTPYVGGKADMFSDETERKKSDLLTLDEAGVRFRRTPRALRALIYDGQLPASKVGRSFLVRLDDLLALFEPRAMHK